MYENFVDLVVVVFVDEFYEKVECIGFDVVE